MSSHTEQMAEIKNLLIDLVKDQPLIYDKNHPLHYRTNARNEVWDEIGKILNIPGKLHNCLNLGQIHLNYGETCSMEGLS